MSGDAAHRAETSASASSTSVALAPVYQTGAQRRRTGAATSVPTIDGGAAALSRCRRKDQRACAA